MQDAFEYRDGEDKVGDEATEFASEVGVRRIDIGVVLEETVDNEGLQGFPTTQQFQQAPPAHEGVAQVEMLDPNLMSLNHACEVLQRPIVRINDLDRLEGSQLRHQISQCRHFQTVVDAVHHDEDSLDQSRAVFHVEKGMEELFVETFEEDLGIEKRASDFEEIVIYEAESSEWLLVFREIGRLW